MAFLYKYKALITEVYDGDTVWAMLDLGFNVLKKTKLRLAGIDSKEMNDKENKEKAETAKKYLKTEIEGKEVEVKSLKPGKYNERYIAFIYKIGDPESYNDKMIKLGLAVPYNGGKRKK